MFITVIEYSKLFENIITASVMKQITIRYWNDLTIKLIRDYNTAGDPSHSLDLYGLPQGKFLQENKSLQKCWIIKKYSSYFEIIINKKLFHRSFLVYTSCSLHVLQKPLHRSVASSSLAELSRHVEEWGVLRVKSERHTLLFFPTTVVKEVSFLMLDFAWLAVNNSCARCYAHQRSTPPQWHKMLLCLHVSTVVQN